MKHSVAILLGATLAAAGCGSGDEPLPDVTEQVTLLQNGEEDGQWAALKNLQWMGAKGAAAVDALRALLKTTRDEDLKAEIAETLAAIGPAADVAAPDLVPLLDSQAPWTRACAAEALGGMGAAALPAWPKLVKLARDPDKDVAAAATEAIRRLKRLKKS